MSSITKAPIAILQNAWKRIAPLELADNSWDNVSTTCPDLRFYDQMLIFVQRLE
jgi:hypothetical protein